MKNIITRCIAISVLCILVVACERPLSEKFAGTWQSTEFIGDPVLTANNFEMQISIDRSGNVSIIAVNRKESPPTVDRVNGKIDGEYLVLNNQEYGKLSLREEHLELAEVKLNKKVIFKRISK